MKLTRRTFVAGASSLAFAGLLKGFAGNAVARTNNVVHGYGDLMPIKDNVLDLPKGFSYQVISELGDMMNDGYTVPNRADGMGCFALDENKVALVRNHEIGLSWNGTEESSKLRPLAGQAYDLTDDGEPLLGGTTTIVYDIEKQERVKEYLSLIGTSVNCAGGVTPWGTWLTCEETTRKSGDGCKQDHGWVFEVPANQEGITKPVPLKAMGRFNHEAAAIDPRTGIVYMTEDRGNSLFYRFIPNEYGKLEKGGKLQALGIVGHEDGFDSRNWDTVSMKQGDWHNARWIDLEETHSPEDDLRLRGYKDGAVIFARGEGIIWGDDELYFCCTNGGPKNIGQVMRYVPSQTEGTQSHEGKIQLFFESVDKKSFGLGDNLTVAPNGHLIVCEDHYDTTDNHMRGITPDGQVYTFAKLNVDSETAGVCFSPNGETMFVNIQQPTMTLAITGPWEQFKV